MYIDTKAFVLREVRYKESDRILTLFTEKLGKITASAHGALSKRSPFTAATQSLTYSDFVLDFRKGVYSVREASVIEYFSGLRADIGKYSLACYICEAVDSLSIEDTPDIHVLRILLNALYALSNDLYAAEQIKAAFELRFLSCTGYQPNLWNCSVCGREEPADPVFEIENGCICCRNCHSSSMGYSISINENVLKAIRFTVSTGIKNYISFRISDEDLKLLSKVSEAFFLEHTDRSFSTLEYWKTVNKDGY